MNIMQRITGLAALTLITACGPLNDGALGQQFAGLVQARMADKTPQTAPTLPPEIVNAGPGNVRLMTLTGRNTVLPMVQVGQNGATATWQGAENISVALEDDILVGTRGLGNDLMGVTANGVRAAIAAGGGTAMRQHSFMNSFDQIATATVECVITRAGPEEVTLPAGPQVLTRYDEACKGPALIFDNVYYVDNSGTILRSKQALSAAEGFMIVDRL